MDLSKLPDLLAVALLTMAFASVARRVQAPGANLWLFGWIFIALHFAAFMFLGYPGAIGAWAAFIGLSSLTWAAVLFVRASLPYRDEPSSMWMSGSLIAVNSTYIAVLVFLPDGSPWLTPAAVLFGLVPLTIVVVTIPDFQHGLRWGLVGLNCALATFLLIFQHRAGSGSSLALNAILFCSYLSCCFNFWYSCRKATTGGFITTAGFLAWALVFVISPVLDASYKTAHVESEVWNLPKYVVAVGMILLVLERQIEHNKFLALHDELTGLPNRRLFHDRLHGTLERARRNGKPAAVLLIDLDCFKQVNDSLGHYMGDLVLKQVGTVFSQRLRGSDTVARTGGDEFSVILEEPITRADADRVARSLSLLLDNPLQVGDHSIRIGASIGVALYPEDGATAESLCIAADLRMYDSKHGARHKQPSHHNAHRRPTFPATQVPVGSL
jgi:diguanylate cyclase (GGDEF)-like protein